MIYLIFAIISSALVSIIMRYSEKYIDNNISMLSINYLMCLILAGIHMGFHHLYIPLHGMNQSIILGIINGILYLSGFILLQRNINKNGIINRIYNIYYIYYIYEYKIRRNKYKF